MRGTLRAYLVPRPCAVLFAVFLFILTGCDLSTTSSDPGVFERVVVTQVVDGDTVHVRLASGETEKIRFIGVDTGEATEYTRQALQGVTVYLETDAELRDAYGRLLAYVWLSEPEPEPESETESEMRESLFNARLLLDGYAQLLTIPPNTRYAERFRGFQSEARDAGRGLWGLDEASGVVFWGDASGHVGQVVTIEGPVVGTYYSVDATGQSTFLNIGRDHPDPSRVTVFIGSFDRGVWSDPPDELYAGETIRVTGKVELYQGVVQIVITEPDAVEVVE